jgi:hypothetical protein
MPDVKHIGEVAGRSLFPCLPQVDADAMVWLRSLHDSLRAPYLYARIRMRADIHLQQHHQHSAC